MRPVKERIQRACGSKLPPGQLKNTGWASPYIPSSHSWRGSEQPVCLGGAAGCPHPPAAGLCQQVPASPRAPDLALQTQSLAGESSWRHWVAGVLPGSVSPGTARAGQAAACIMRSPALLMELQSRIRRGKVAPFAVILPSAATQSPGAPRGTLTCSTCCLHISLLIHRAAGAQATDCVPTHQSCPLQPIFSHVHLRRTKNK